MIPVNDPLLNGKEKEYLLQCITDGWISSDGPFVKQFEEMFAKFVGTKHGIAVCNGTVAIELAIASLDIQPGDEIILPAHTIISCALGIIRRGAKPVLVDVDPETWTMNAAEVEKKITIKTKAIMPVHMFGHSCDMDPLIALAEKYDLHIIEDSAEAHGATYKGRQCGSMSDVSTFSFYANKIVTTGEGGMVMTDNDEIAARARSFRNLCFLPQQRFLHEELGYNFRITNLQAAVGVAQMERVEYLLERKKAQGKKYTELFGDLNGITLQGVKEWATHVYWVFGLLLNNNVPFNAFEWAKKLSDAGVQTRPFFWPLHEQPAFHKLGLFLNEHYPVTENLARRGLYVPSGMALTEEQMEKVSLAVHETLRGI
ncbi:MAG: DegT/DnrJ/EryC1/StrS family aminotransferase [Bacteroidota bacterium]|nr:DegT/DnrJ/EryC1/StrS family aminotransferase [Bacteroidota bacterium]